MSLLYLAKIFPLFLPCAVLLLSGPFYGFLQHRISIRPYFTSPAKL